MSITGRISVDALFHDTDGTASISVVSLSSSQEYTAGKVAIVTGTAGTAGVYLSEWGQSSYRDASGNVVNFSSISRVVFSWDGADPANCDFTSYDGGNTVLRSAGGEVAVTRTDISTVLPVISADAGTGTYTIIAYGE